MEKILIIDDDPIIEKIYRDLFLRAGYEVQVVKDGEHAFQALKESRPNLVLLDLFLPKINGVEILKFIRSKHAPCQLPVVVFSTNATSRYMDAAWKTGANRCLAKDHFEPRHVLNIVRETLDESEAANEAEIRERSNSAHPALSDGSVRGVPPQGMPAPRFRPPSPPAHAPPAPPPVAPPLNGSSSPHQGAVSAARTEDEEDLAFQAEVRQAFLQRSPQMVATLRGGLQEVVAMDERCSAAAKLTELHRRLVSMSGALRTAGLAAHGVFCDALARLIGDFVQRPELFKGSPLRTAGQAIERLDSALAQASRVRTGLPSQERPGIDLEEAFQQHIREAFLKRAAVAQASFHAFVGELKESTCGPSAGDKVAELIRKAEFLARHASASGCEPICRPAEILGTLLKLLQAAAPSSVDAMSASTIGQAVVILDDSIQRVAERAGTPPTRGLVLVIEDNVPASEALYSCLKKAECQVIAVNSLPWALPLVEQHRFELILCKAGLGGLGATDLAMKAQAAPANAATPLLAVTECRDLDPRSLGELSPKLDGIGYPFVESELTLKLLIHLTPESGP